MWSPSSVIFRGPETSALDVLVTYSPTAGVVVSYEANILTANDIFTATATPTGIRVEDIDGDLSGGFPIAIKWVEDDLVETAGDDWDDLPQGASLTDFTPSGLTEMSYMVECSCTYQDTSLPPLELTSTVTLPVIIVQDYSSNKDILKQKVSEEDPR